MEFEEKVNILRKHTEESDEHYLLPMKQETPLHCQACREIYKTPYIAFPCGCTYCEKCKDCEACPVCLRWVEQQIPNAALRDSLDAIKVRCCNYFDDPSFEKERQPNERCTWLLKRSDREQHERQCQYAWKRCPHLGCDEVYLMKDAEFHEKECPHAEIICPICAKDKELDFCCGQRKVKCGFENCDWYGFEVYSVNHRNICLFRNIDAETKTRKRLEKRFKENYKKRKNDEKTKSYGIPDEFYLKREPRHRKGKSNLTQMTAMSEPIFDYVSTVSAPVYSPANSIHVRLMSGRLSAREDEARASSEKSRQVTTSPIFTSFSSSTDSTPSGENHISSPTSSTLRSTESLTYPSTKKKITYSFDLRLMKFLRKELGDSGLEYRENGGVNPLALVQLSIFKRWKPNVQSFIDIADSDPRRYGTEKINGIIYIRANYGHAFPVTKAM